MHSHCRNLARYGALVLSTLLAVAGCGGGGGGSSGAGDAPPAPTPWALQATDAAALTTYLRAALGPSGASYYQGTGAVFSEAAAAPPGSFSGTTLQETGVDEDDLIKSDGAFVWSLDHAASAWQRATLRRQQLGAAAAALTPVDSLALPFSANVNGSGLYLDADRRQLVALGGSGSVYTLGGISPAAIWFAPPSYWGQGATEAMFVSAPDGTPMQVTRRLHITASLIGSRRVGTTLYLVLRSYPNLPGFDPSWQPANTAANSALLAALQPQQAFPTIAVDGGTPQPLVDPASCLMQSQNVGGTADIVTVLGIDLATGDRGARCFIGRTEAFYMSPTNLYLATTRFTYDTSGTTPTYQAQTSTDIHKFTLDGLAVTYRGSGNVPGHLGFNQATKSFRFGEWQEALRVVTQTQTAGFVSTTATGTPTSTASPAQLTILQERNGALVTVGQLPNAARPDPIGKPGELLYASRFIGARGYIVTYRLIDPLYVLDLSNPADPKVAGQLEVSGYSDYLFPLSETLLLGVGKDAIADGTAGDGRFAWYQGVKVSLIDVTDPAHPLEAARQVIGHRGSQATVLWDHHGVAIQQAGASARISLPVDVHDTPPAVLTGKPSDYWSYTRTELQRFDVDLAAAKLTQRPALAGTVTTPGDRSITADRSLLWGDQVHWYQDGVWASGAW